RGLNRKRRQVYVEPSHDDEGRLIIPPRVLGYDTLVIAVGSVSNDFGTPGVAEHAIKLDTVDEAARFNRRMINACLRANAQYEPLRPGQLHCAIVGAGATGVELAAELHNDARHRGLRARPHRLRQADPADDRRGRAEDPAPAARTHLATDARAA